IHSKHRRAVAITTAVLGLPRTPAGITAACAGSSKRTRCWPPGSGSQDGRDAGVRPRRVPLTSPACSRAKSAHRPPSGGIGEPPRAASTADRSLLGSAPSSPWSAASRPLSGPLKPRPAPLRRRALGHFVARLEERLRRDNL